MMAKERPIIFSGEMVRAILDGRKRQTRRVIKPQPPWWIEKSSGWAITTDGEWYTEVGPAVWTMRSPYGQPGDRLWVRETWCAPFITEVVKPSEMPMDTTVKYRADGLEYTRWTPSIFMPRWASRIILEITDIRVERLQEISHMDAIGEGVERISGGLWKCYDNCSNHKTGHDKRSSSIASFMSLWNSINAKRRFSWDDNPWVWVLTFRRIRP